MRKSANQPSKSTASIFSVRPGIFDGRQAVHALSGHAGEERWIATSKLSGRMISVVYTLRDDKIRIITARRARKNEQREYYENHPGGSDPPEG